MNLRLTVLVLLISYFFAGCTTTLKQSRLIDPELQPYVDRFEQTYSISITYPVLLGSGRGDAAYCLDRSKIIVDKDLWPWYTENNKIELLFHEFGHCTFNREHESDRFEAGKMQGCAKSLMTTREFVSQTPCFEQYYDYYVHELPGEF